ncbi:hypothetical protein VUR80DRAFT_4292 [Thermomyces stellatus]
MVLRDEGCRGGGKEACKRRYRWISQPNERHGTTERARFHSRPEPPLLAPRGWRLFRPSVMGMDRSRCTAPVQESQAGPFRPQNKASCTPILRQGRRAFAARPQRRPLLWFAVGALGLLVITVALSPTPQSLLSSPPAGARVRSNGRYDDGIEVYINPRSMLT